MIIPRFRELKRNAQLLVQREKITWRTLLEPSTIFALLVRYGYLQFFLVGGSGVLINIGITWFLTTYVYGLENYFKAYLIGIAVNLIWNFTLYSFALFKTKHHHFRRLVVFALYAITVTWINTVIVSIVTPIIGLEYYLLVITATIFLLSTVNFFVFKLSLFKEDAEIIGQESMSMFEIMLRYKAEILIFLLALTLRIAMIVTLPTAELYSFNTGADGGDYVNEAKNIVEGRGFSRSWQEPYVPDAIRTPLYPLFLAGIYIVFGSFIPTVGVEALLSSFLPLVGMAIVSFFVRHRLTVILAGIFIALEPHLAYFTTFFASEGIFIILLYTALLLVLVAHKSNKTTAYAGAGFVLGLAALARPIVTYLPALLAVYFAVVGIANNSLRAHAKNFAVFAAVFFVVLSPWLVRNYITFDNFGMGTVGWFNVYTRLAATVKAIDENKDFYTVYHELLDELSYRGYIQHPPPVTEYEIQHPEWGDVLRTESLRVIGEHPRAFVIYMVTAPISVLTQDNTLLVLQHFTPLQVERPPFSPTLFVSQHGVVEGVKALLPYLKGAYLIPYFGRALWSAMFLLACMGAIIAWRRGLRFESVFIGTFILYIVALSINAGAQIDGRYRVQFIVCEVALAAVALESIVQYFRKRRTKIDYDIHYAQSQESPMKVT